MKLASYMANGKACFGVVTGDGVVTLNERLGGRYASLRDMLAADALADARKAAEGEDLAAIRKATEELQQAAHAIGELLYKGSGGSGGPGESGGSGQSGVKDAEVVDAEYAESV